MLRITVILLSVSLAAATHAADADFVTESGDRVEGERLSDIAAMAVQVGRVRKAVRDAFGLEIGDTPVHVVTSPDLRRLHDEIGDRLPHRWSLDGFEWKGHVFVRRGLGGVSDEVLIHECLHAASERFSGEAHARGVPKLVEGITQYLTLQALAARPRSAQLRAERNRVYVAYTRFAEALGTLVGEPQLRAAYLRDGFQALAARVDRATGGRRRLLDAARLLQAGDEQAAAAKLTGTR